MAVKHFNPLSFIATAYVEILRSTPVHRTDLHHLLWGFWH